MEFEKKHTKNCNHSGQTPKPVLLRIAQVPSRWEGFAQEALLTPRYISLTFMCFGRDNIKQDTFVAIFFGISAVYIYIYCIYTYTVYCRGIRSSQTCRVSNRTSCAKPMIVSGLVHLMLDFSSTIAGTKPRNHPHQCCAPELAPEIAPPS